MKQPLEGITEGINPELVRAAEPLRGLGGGDASVSYKNWEKGLL